MNFHLGQLSARSWHCFGLRRSYGLCCYWPSQGHVILRACSTGAAKALQPQHKAPISSGAWGATVLFLARLQAKAGCWRGIQGELKWASLSTGALLLMLLVLGAMVLQQLSPAVKISLPVFNPGKSGTNGTSLRETVTRCRNREVPSDPVLLCRYMHLRNQPLFLLVLHQALLSSVCLKRVLTKLAASKGSLTVLLLMSIAVLVCVDVYTRESIWIAGDSWNLIQ